MYVMEKTRKNSKMSSSTEGKFADLALKCILTASLETVPEKVN